MGNRAVGKLKKDCEDLINGRRKPGNGFESHTVKVFGEWNKASEKFKKKHGITSGEMFGPK